MGKRQGKKVWIGKQVRAMLQGREMALAEFALDAILSGGEWLNEAAEKAVAADAAAVMPWDDMPPEARYKVEDGVAVVEVGGMITHGLSSFERWWLGAVEVAEVAETVEAAARDERARAIVLSVNSPGGMVCGVPEAAARIADVAARVPMIAQTDTMMCSAAYWLASPAAAIYATPSATVGSIGAYTVHFDLSRAYENAGIGLKIFRSGRQKAAGVDGAALTEDQAAIIADRISAIGAEFRGFVQRFRGELPDAAKDGRAVDGAAGLGLGLVDSAATLADAVADARTLADFEDWNNSRKG